MATKHKACTKPLDNNVGAKFLSPRIRSVTTAEEMVAPIKRLSASLESSVADMRTEVVGRIDKEMNNSQNTRDFITHKYEDLCDKIKSLAEISCTVTTFKGELKNLERSVDDLQLKVDKLEKKFRSSSPLPGLRETSVLDI